MRSSSIVRVQLACSHARYKALPTASPFLPYCSLYLDEWQQWPWDRTCLGDLQPCWQGSSSCMPIYDWGLFLALYRQELLLT